MNKLSSDRYQFSVEPDIRGLKIIISDTETGLFKVFNQYMHGTIDSMYAHLNTLTDSLCEQFVGKKDHKKKVKE